LTKSKKNKIIERFSLTFLLGVGIVMYIQGVISIVGPREGRTVYKMTGHSKYKEELWAN